MAFSLCPNSCLSINGSKHMARSKQSDLLKRNMFCGYSLKKNVYRGRLQIARMASDGLPVGLPHLDVKIKWPNDLYLNELKVGGILCTSTYSSQTFHVTVGVGLNIDNGKPTTCLNDVMRKISSSIFIFQREDIIASFFNKFEALFDVFLSQGGILRLILHGYFGKPIVDY